MLPDTLLSLTRIFSWRRIYFGKPALPSIVNSLQGVIGEGLPKAKGASPPFLGNALSAKSYIGLDRKSIIGIFEIWL